MTSTTTSALPATSEAKNVGSKVPKNWNMRGRRPYVASDELEEIMEESTGLRQTLGTKEITAFVSNKKRKSYTRYPVGEAIRSIAPSKGNRV